MASDMHILLVFRRVFDCPSLFAALVVLVEVTFISSIDFTNTRPTDSSFARSGAPKWQLSPSGAHLSLTYCASQSVRDITSSMQNTTRCCVFSPCFRFPSLVAGVLILLGNQAGRRLA